MDENTLSKRYTVPGTGKFAVGNPGKPVGARHMTTKLMEAIVKIADGESDPDDVLIIRAWLKRAKAGDMRAIEVLVGYTDGKPLQGIDLTTLGESLNKAGTVIAAIDESLKANG